MNQNSVMQRVASFDPNQRIRFYEDLIAMLATEVEACYPDGVPPGKEYDEAIRKVTSLIRVKGKIHAFFKLNIRGDLTPKRMMESADLSIPGDAEFLTGLIAELDGDPEIQKRVGDILSNVSKRVTTLPGTSRERHYGSHYGSTICQTGYK